MPNKRRKYDEEFKKRAVGLSYSSERSIAETAQSLVLMRPCCIAGENNLHQMVVNPNGRATR